MDKLVVKRRSDQRDEVIAMHLIVMYSCPHANPEERKSANRFREFLKREGFAKIQPGAYERACALDRVDAMLTRIEENAPAAGRALLFALTERQYENRMVIYPRLGNLTVAER